MSMSAAERQRKHREKLRSQQPDKYEERKRKHAEYMKNKRKVIGQLSAMEQNKRRKQWREANARRKNKKCEKIENESQKEPPKTEAKKAKNGKKKKGKKAKDKPKAENSTSIEEKETEDENINDVKSEDENDDNEENENDEEASISNASCDSDSINLQFDGIMKVAPEYPEFNEYGENKVEKIENEFFENTQVIKEELINFRALQQYAKTYELENFDKNYLLIFNQENIINYEPRIGTKQDVEALKTTFSKYKFECYEHHDLTKDEIIEKLKIFESKDFTDYGCIAVAVLTHGNRDGLLRARDREYSEMEIINYFKTHDKPTLVTKPKLLIIQACRGQRLTPAVPVLKSLHMRLDHDMEVVHYTLPVESDMMILHSSYIGCPSIRSEIDGSWFIQTLCKKIDELSEELDLESILTEVKREVAIDLHYDQYNRITYEVDIYKQMPVVTSTLIRKLYLKPKNDQTLADDPLQTYLDGPQTQRSSQSEISSLARLSVQCMCHLDHFAYIKNCLSYFLADNPEDKIAQSYLELSNTFEDNNTFDASKETMAKVICNHLRNNASRHDYYKYIYMHKH